MKEIKFNGVKIDETPDSRNYVIAQFVPGKDVIKDEEYILPMPNLDVIINQAEYGACVAHSLATSKSILEYIHTNKWIDFDPFVIYGTRNPGDYIGVGMHAWQAVKTLKNEGVYFRRDFNIRQEMPELRGTVRKWKEANPDKVKQAADYKITGYSDVRTVDDVKKALKNKMPVTATYGVYDSFLEVKDDGIVPIKKKDDTLIGYHQLTIVGWTSNNYWITINSWGNGDGLKGMYLMPMQYRFHSAIAISDTITPSKYKAKDFVLHIGDMIYIVDGDTKQFDSVPFIDNDRTYLPVRFICEALGASVEWIDTERKVIIRSEEAIIEMTIDNPKMIINGKEYLNDVSPKIVNDRTMLPIRIIAETLNCKVDWNNGEVTIRAL